MPWSELVRLMQPDAAPVAAASASLPDRLAVEALAPYLNAERFAWNDVRDAIALAVCAALDEAVKVAFAESEELHSHANQHFGDMTAERILRFGASIAKGLAGRIEALKDGPAPPNPFAAALAALANAADAYMRYHAEKFYGDASLKPSGLWPRIEAARAVLHGVDLPPDPRHDALAAIVDWFRENTDPRDWPGVIRDADELLHGRRA